MAARLPLLPLLALPACFAEVSIDGVGPGDDSAPVIIPVDCTASCADTSTDAGSQVCYSCRCKEAMDGWLPSVDEFQCANGEEIVIYTSEADGSLSPVDTQVSTCANPTLLYGTCAPGGRLGQITHGTVTAKYICRRNQYGDADDESLPYDDVGLILYNSRNGASCWFDDMDGTGIAGRNMPDMDLTNGDTANQDTFLGYYYRTEGEGCVGCHDNDPFNYTPFLQSVSWKTGDYTSGTFSRVTLEGTLVSTGASHLVSPEAAACTSCHRITSTSTCGSWAPDAIGSHKGSGYEDRVVDAAADPHSELWWLGTWMPYEDGVDPITDREAWESTYGDAAEVVQTCCAQPGVETETCQWEPTPEG
jgi:hypothetical protein